MWTLLFILATVGIFLWRSGRWSQIRPAAVSALAYANNNRGKVIDFLKKHLYYVSGAILLLLLIMSLRDCSGGSAPSATEAKEGRMAMGPFLLAVILFAGAFYSNSKEKEKMPFFAFSLAGVGLFFTLISLGSNHPFNSKVGTLWDLVLSGTGLGLFITAIVIVFLAIHTSKTNLTGLSKVLAVAAGAVILSWVLPVLKEKIQTVTGLEFTWIFFLALGFLGLYAWRRKRYLFVIFLILITSWIGTENYTKLVDGIPDQLKPGIPAYLEPGFDKLGKAFGKRLEILADEVAGNSSSDSSGNTAVHELTWSDLSKAKTTRALPPGKYEILPGEGIEVCTDANLPYQKTNRFEIKIEGGIAVISRIHKEVKIYKRE